jgi:hypothetical protein
VNQELCFTPCFFTSQKSPLPGNRKRARLKKYRTNFSSYLPSLSLAGFGTVPKWVPLPRLHRASPSASLDKKVLICSCRLGISEKIKIPFRKKRTSNLKVGLFLSVKLRLLDLAQIPKGFRCRGVIGPVPQPLLIRR